MLTNNQVDRIGSLSKADRDDLFELLQEWRKTDDPEDRKSIRRAMEEILAQIPIELKPMALPKHELSGLSKSWAVHVGRQIRALRKKARLTQEQLAAKANLPQAHISRLENAEHTATYKTLEKIANALGAAVGEIDPCGEGG